MRRSKNLIEPIAKALIAIGLTANAVTVIGAVGTIVVAIATGVTGWLFGGSGCSDSACACRFVGWLDRRAYHGWDRISGLFSTPRSIASLIGPMLVGVIIFFLMHRDWWHTAIDNTPDYTSMIGIAAAAVAVMTSFVTSYARARAESVGYEVKKRHRHSCRSLDHHSGGHGHHRIDASGIVARHRHDTVGRIGISHRIPTHLRSQAPNGHREKTYRQ